MAGRQKDSPDRTVRANKSILICIFIAALVLNGVFWIVDRNVKIHNAEEALSELETVAYSAEKADGGFVRNMALQKGSKAKSDKHGIVLEDRQNMTLTGVSEVLNFDEQKIVVITNLGQLTITGRSLHIKKFNPQTGDLCVAGTIDSLVYADKDESIGSRWKRIKEALGTRLNRAF